MAIHVDFTRDRYKDGDLLPLNEVSGFLEGNPCVRSGSGENEIVG